MAGDYIKSLINIPKWMLKIINLYPEKQNKCTIITFPLMFICVLLLEMGQTVALVLNFWDVTQMANTCTTVSTTFQALFKLKVLYENRRKLQNMIEILRTEFWPAEIASAKLEKVLRFQTKFVAGNMITIYVIALLFAVEFISLPLFNEKRELPFLSYLPFEWKASPVYEMMYVFQGTTNIYINITSICGLDFLFVALMYNLIGQFRLLGFVLRKAKSEKAEVLKRKLDDWRRSNGCGVGDQNLQNICIEHHTRLLSYCDEMEEVFSSTVFIQYVASTSAICVSSFLITMIEKSKISHLFAFCVGHVAQLFLYCMMGNELTYVSSEIGTSVFHSKWYLQKDHKSTRDLIMVIRRSQRDKKITGLRFMDLNFVSFAKVLRLSFSFHTLLHSIDE